MKDDINKEEKKKPKYFAFTVIVLVLAALVLLGVKFYETGVTDIPNSSSANVDESGNVIEVETVPVEPAQADAIAERVVTSSSVTINILPAEAGEETK